MKRLFALALALLTAAPVVAAPITIDFSGTPNGTFPSYTESGVTFTAVNGTGLTSTGFGNTPAGLRGLAGATLAEIRATLPAGVTFVSVDLGDFNADADTLFIEARNAADMVIGFTSLFIPSTFTGMQTLTLATPPGTASVLFGARSPAVQGSSVYADNFTFDVAAQTSAVPEPATLAVFGAVVGVGGLVARRRSKAAA